jgi:malate dehydrogenase (oxaloacetate-decarboxylating)
MALANPVPEIMPEEAYEAGAYIVCTGRSDFPNQVNNSLAFPGIFRSIHENRINTINDDMKLAAAYGIAAMIPDEKLKPTKVIPLSLDSDVPRMVAEIVRDNAIKHDLIRENPNENKFLLRKNSKIIFEEFD